MSDSTPAPERNGPSSAGQRDEPSTSGKPSGASLEDLQQQVRDLRDGLRQKGEEAKTFQQRYDLVLNRLSNHPQKDSIMDYLRTGQVPSEPGDTGSEDEDELVSKAAVEGDPAALKQILAKLRKQIQTTTEQQRTEASQSDFETKIDLALLRLSRNPGYDPSFFEKNSDFWKEITSESEYAVYNDIFAKNPEKALELCYRDYIAKHGDPVKMKKDREDLERKKRASIMEGREVPDSIIELAKKKGQPLSMYEIAKANGYID